jgi:hypothetical protein
MAKPTYCLRSARAFGLVLGLVLGSVACGGDEAGIDARPPDAPIADAGPPDATPLPDATPPVDARMPVLDCQDPTPPTPDDPIVLTGLITGLPGAGGTEPLPTASVAGYKRTDTTTPIATGTVDGAAMYTLSAPTAGAPLDGFVRFAAPNYLPTNLFAPDPLRKSATINSPPLFGTGLISLLELVGDYLTEAGTGIVLFRVVDCDNKSVEGATVTLDPPGGLLRYAAAGDQPIPSKQQMKTSSNGTVFIFNRPPGPMTIKVDYMGTKLQDNTVLVFDTQVTSTLVHQ